MNKVLKAAKWLLAVESGTCFAIGIKSKQTFESSCYAKTLGIARILFVQYLIILDYSIKIHPFLKQISTLKAKPCKITDNFM